MCGIAGFFQSNFDFTENKNLWYNKIINMRDSLTHRGPDDNGIFITHNTCFAHRRLSIRDISGGHQPMTRHFNGTDATIVYNGELYNAEEVKQLLHPYTVEFSTTSDTEVILNAFLVFGAEIFPKLNGIFSFCIYDGNRIFLVRDHLGVKPLFYMNNSDMFLFASEPKAIFAYGIKPEIDNDGWCEIFGLGPARTLGKGIFKNMQEVLPGHFIMVSSPHGHAIVEDFTYWKLKGAGHEDDYDTTVEKVSYLIHDSIKRQMVSDIPICSFLSGGLDSSLVSAICQKELIKKGKTLDTFSFEFAGNNKNFKANAFQSSLDRPFVDIMTNHIKSNHTYLECDNNAQIDCLFEAVDARDVPCMADVESSLLYFCKKVAIKNQVALTGECADEIFGGYPWFHRKEMWDRNAFPWSYDMQARTVLLKDDFVKELNIDDYVQNAYDTTIAETPRCLDDNITEKRRREIAWLNIRWFMMTLLNRMDRTSMYSGLEARVPFADYRILEYVYNIPWDMKCKNGQTKSLLIEAGKDLLPHDILYRKKSPYPKTYDPTYENLLGERLMDMLSDTNHPLHNICDYDKVVSFLKSQKDYGKPWYGQLMAGPQMIAYMIQTGYWMEKYNIH